MRLLLTGSNGFVGARIAADARRRGWQVIGLGRSAAPSGPVDAYVRHDLATPIPADAAIGPVDAVVHCAALASPWAPPREFIAANVHGTRHVAQWAAHHGAPPLVYISSSSVLYRDADQFDLSATSPVPADDQQINTYSRTKLLGERIVAGYPGRSTVLRPRAVFGVGDTVLLPRILRLASRGVVPMMERADGPRVRVDLTDVGTVAHYVTETVNREVSGTYILTNAEPVELYPFLLHLLGRLGFTPRPMRISPRAAMAMAGAGERASAWLADYAEPPITRFGVSVLSRSKTFDVTATLRDLGTPAVPLAESVDALVAAHG